jgi:tRNA threonylcarbamoyladenosine biosynthesis protein TsaE
MQIISKSVKATLNIGRGMAKHLQRGDIICLFGQLGSGKTVLTKGIAWGLGISRGAVSSPSFVLISQYAGRKLALNHFDLYRLKEQREILTLGYEDYLYGEAVSVIEWADRLGDLLPKECLKIELRIKSDRRRVLKFSALGSRFNELLKAFVPDGV